MSDVLDGSRLPPALGAAVVSRDQMAASFGAAFDQTAAGQDESIPRPFLFLADVLVLACAFLAAFLLAPLAQKILISASPLRLGLRGVLAVPSGPAGAFPEVGSMLWLLGVTVPATVMFMELLGGYGALVDQSRTRVAGSAILSAAVSLSFAALFVFALKLSTSSRLLIFTYGFLVAVGLVTYRSLLRGYKRRRRASGAYAKNVLVIARPGGVDWVAAHFRDTVDASRFRLAGCLTTELPGTSPHALHASGLNRLGAVDDLGSLLVHRPVHEVIAVTSLADRDWLGPVIEACGYFRVRLRIVPETLLTGALHDVQLTFRTDPLKLPEIVLSPSGLDSDALFIKRMFDIVVSATLLVLLSPLFLLIAIAIKLTTPKLPVLYPWRVVGLKGRPFVGYKFTTMVAGAEERRAELLARNEMSGPVFKVKDDPRTTRLGRLLRKFSLNELPQLWSVLTGDMSLVGPRPAFRHELERYELWHKRKLCVKPGITCLWQVSGRNKINSFDDWVRLDLQYIDEWSFWLDVRILVRTVWAVVGGTGS